MNKPKSITQLSKEQLEDLCLNLMHTDKVKTEMINQLESTLNEVKEWKEEFGDACTFSIVSNPSLGNWYFALEDILEKGGSNE